MRGAILPSEHMDPIRSGSNDGKSASHENHSGNQSESSSRPRLRSLLSVRVGGAYAVPRPPATGGGEASCWGGAREARALGSPRLAGVCEIWGSRRAGSGFLVEGAAGGSFRPFEDAFSSLSLAIGERARIGLKANLVHQI